MAWVSPRTWVSNEQLTAALLNAQLRDQLLELNGTSSAWTPYTPTLTQSGSLANTVRVARYKQMGKIVHVQLYVEITGAGTAGQPILVGLPVTAQQGTYGVALGSGWFSDQSASTRYVLSWLTQTTTSAIAVNDASGGSGFGTAPAVTAASGDVLTANLMYEAA